MTVRSVEPIARPPVGSAGEVAVTGARGFVGRHLVRLLVEAGHTVRALSRTPGNAVPVAGVRWHRADLARVDTATMREFLDGVTVLYHCAGEIRDERAMHALHVEGTARLVDAAAGNVPRVVHLSSCGVYGSVRTGTVDEAHALRPTGIYETTKLQAEQAVLAAAQDGAFAAVVVRPSVVIAEDMPNDSLRSWIARIARGQFLFIGGAGARVNYVHVADVARALERAASADLAQPFAYNLSLGATVEDVVGVVCEEVGRPMIRARVPASVARTAASFGDLVPGFPLTRGRVSALTNRAHYDASRIVADLGFAYTVPLHEGVRRLVRSMGLAAAA